MSEIAPQSGRPARNGNGRTLLDRVRDQVTTAGDSIDRRSRSPLRPPRRTRSAPRPSLDGSVSPAHLTREVRAMRIVFKELGETHRRYRRRTGQPVSPALRAAAIAFKQEPSMISLLPVAAFLDELGVLEW